MSSAWQNSDAKNPDQVFLTVKEAAEFLRLKRATLDLYRCEGRGPEYRKHGARVFYTLSNLIAWSSDNRYQSTSQRIRKN